MNQAFTIHLRLSENRKVWNFTKKSGQSLFLIGFVRFFDPLF